MALFWLDDGAWSVIQPLLPTHQPGARRVDDRRVISGIIHVLRAGCPWRDTPRDYGPYTTIYNRFNSPRRSPDRRPCGNRISRVLAADGRGGGSGSACSRP